MGVYVAMAIPKRRHWSSPRNTGSAVHIPAKREQISVPPVAIGTVKVSRINTKKIYQLSKLT